MTWKWFLLSIKRITYQKRTICQHSMVNVMTWRGFRFRLKWSYLAGQRLDSSESRKFPTTQHGKCYDLKSSPFSIKTEFGRLNAYKSLRRRTSDHRRFYEFDVSKTHFTLVEAKIISNRIITFHVWNVECAVLDFIQDISF